MARLRKKRLTLERLEDRRVLTAYSVPWPEIQHLTLSFAPDQTMAGTQSSGLFAMLDAQMPRQQWQETILRAFQTWAVEANSNIGLVSDGGEPFGVLGLKQGDTRFGDVRIGAYPMAPDVVAVANPYDPFVANTWVGDVFLNSSFDITASSGNSSADLFAIALHEAGHVFGIGHSGDPSSPMYAHLQASTGTLTSADVAQLQSLYKSRPADVWEGPVGNEGLKTATQLEFGDSGVAGSVVDVQADISSLSDTDTYRIVAPQTSTSFNVYVHASGFSLLAPKVIVRDAQGQVLASVATVDPLHNDVMVHVDGIAEGQPYFVQVSGARSDVFGIGGYVLRVQALNSANAGASRQAPFSFSTPGSAEQSSNEPIQILATTPGYVEHTYYEVYGELSPVANSRTFQVRSVDVGPDMTNVMTIVFDGAESPDTKFEVQVVDDQGQYVPANTILDANGETELQIPSVISASDYFITVSSKSTLQDDAEFELEVDFAQDGRHLETLVNDSLASGQETIVRDLFVQQSENVHFVLGSSDWSVPAETGVRMSIAQPDGRVVFSMTTADGTLRSGNTFLDRGHYLVTFSRAVSDTSRPVIFQLSGLTTSDPLGPQLRDTTWAPLEDASDPALVQLSSYWLPNDLARTAVVAANNALPGARSESQSSSSVTYVGDRMEVPAKSQPLHDIVFQRTSAERAIASAIVLPEETATPAMRAAMAFAGGTSETTLQSSPMYQASGESSETSLSAGNRASTKVQTGDPETASTNGRTKIALGKNRGECGSGSATASEAPTLSDRLLAWIRRLGSNDFSLWFATATCCVLRWRAVKGTPEDRSSAFPGRAKLGHRHPQRSTTKVG